MLVKLCSIFLSYSVVLNSLPCFFKCVLYKFFFQQFIGTIRVNTDIAFRKMLVWSGEPLPSLKLCSDSTQLNIQVDITHASSS